MKIFFLLVLLSSTFNYSFSQLANQKIILLKNFETYDSNSALGEYTASSSCEYTILGTDAGTSFVDIIDSVNIVEVYFVERLTSNWREMKTYDHYAYTVSEATGGKLQIVDLEYFTDSVSLEKICRYETIPKHIHISVGTF